VPGGAAGHQNLKQQKIITAEKRWVASNLPFFSSFGPLHVTSGFSRFA